MISQLPYFSMLKTTAADFHPPGYYTVVELWYKIFPTTEVSTRLISVIFYFLTVFMVYKLVYFIAHPGGENGGKRFWGLISALAVLVNPIFFTYAFEARNYTMFAFFATGSIYYLIKLMDSGQLKDSELNRTARMTENRLPRGRWALAMTKNSIFFVLFSTLGIYTHYYMFFILASQGLYLLLFDRKTFFSMIMVYFVIGVLYLPWIPFLLGQLTSVQQGYWISQVDGRTHYEALLRILGGEHKNVFRPILFGLSITLILVGLIQHIRQRSFERPYILIWLWSIIPFILATLPGLRIDGVKLPFRPIFFWRYLIPAAVPLSMVIVHAAQKLPSNLFKISITAVIVLSLVIDYLTLLRYPATFKQVYTNEIVGRVKSDDKIVTVLPSFAEVLYYRNRNGLKNDIVVLNEGLVQFSGKSLLDAYVSRGIVKIDDYPDGRYFELRPGPTIQRMD